MKEPETPPSLEALGKNIERLHEKVDSRSKPRSQGNNAGMQVGLELVAGILIGTGVGIMLDKWTGLSPLFLIIFFLFGTAGGFMAIYRLVNNQQATEDLQKSEIKHSDESETKGE